MKIRRLLFTVTLALGLTLALLWLLGANLPHVRAATYQVTTTNASGSGSLLQAILNANSSPGHDTITFGSGISGTIVLTGSLPAIDDDVTIIGLGAEQLAVSGDGKYRVFYIDSGAAVTLTGMTVRDGYATDGHIANYAEGGGIWTAGTLYLDRVHLVNNTAIPGFGRGGGVYVHSGSVTISGTQMFDNEASWDGGGAYINGSSGSVTVNGGQVFRNVAQSGGGISAYGNVVLAGTQIFSNVATYDGGGVYILDGVTLVGTLVFSNVSEDGGGVYVDSGFGIATLFDGTQIVGNTASEYGGGVYVAYEDATLNMTDGEISHNVAGIHGGGLYVSEGTAILTGTQVFSNTASEYGGGARVGGVYADHPTARLSMSSGEISNNTATYGGGVYLYWGNATLSNTRVVSNTAPEYDGGGVYVEQVTALLNVSGGEISDNTAGYAGGGVYIHEGSATLNGAQVLRNVAVQNGGGMNICWGSATLNDTQVLSNTVSSQGGGGVPRARYCNAERERR